MTKVLLLLETVTAKSLLQQCINDQHNAHFITGVNGCLDGNGGCEQICTFVNGSVRCSCNPGFVLASDGANCDGKKESLCHGAAIWQCI